MAVATVFAVVIALFGELLKNRFLRVKLSAEIVDPKGDLTNWSQYAIVGPQGYGVSGYSSTSGQYGSSGYASHQGTAGTPGLRVIYYHLRIKNEKQCNVAYNCRVVLKKISKKIPSEQTFKELPLSVPPRFFWAPAETSPQLIDFVNDQILDFGFIVENSGIFTPAITPRFNNFQGDLKKDESFQYVIEIVSNNSKPKQYTIEVFWDGRWDSNLNNMAKSFKIKIL